jgi:hypothetical protein
MDTADLKKRFAYHAPKDDATRRAHERVRAYLGQMAEEFNDTLPEGREKSLAITKLEEAMYWANAAIARQ